ncbi:MAG: NADH:ubiquinone oxidoreductase subunit NDUFA12 [Alphaproteobacteria bacterium]|nr:NADH:ubiquinone oxidoreductase subunit NDUFA12 [Alphaproteobacteria bacterium]MCZ6495228.1 NADH:ubiquinone oxidoreductase subunit NDUFA12 [Alphaproteobacteria bacterium]MCZ6609055.1 NADH:ubiquinone oxidoreductase subunit NDUFA12 [Alphaproteobacteria bacterium]MCZ6741220.1 NADH:ubiquinone oxidoreductase subunit NDUFA12 [Alphaproteobacteria bacterium]MCZ6814997.1 NADH:ubiquinone oxidoreductase subunit NDUFA12 [Alphaproteobacteria bacterium]
MTLGIRLLTWLRGELVGTDEYANRYYRDPVRRDPKNNGRERRWVLYDGEAEGSKVPEVWHAWLHHMTDELPDAGALARRPWQKPHQANMTGTADAYRPPGSVLAGGKRARATGDYEPWTPD